MGRRLTPSVGRLTVLHVVTIVVLHVVGVEIVELVCVGVGVGDHRFDTI